MVFAFVLEFFCACHGFVFVLFQKAWCEIELCSCSGSSVDDLGKLKTADLVPFLVIILCSKEAVAAVLSRIVHLTPC